MFEIVKKPGKQPGKPATSRKVPSIRTLSKWVENGVAKATDGCKVESDGCKVESDGYCEHNQPSWLVYLNLI